MQTTFEVDAMTLAHISALKTVFGVRTNAAVIRRSLTLLKVCAEEMREDGTIIFVPPTGRPVSVLLRD